MKRSILNSRLSRVTIVIALVSIFSFPVYAQKRDATKGNQVFNSMVDSAQEVKSTRDEGHLWKPEVPAGTILPVVLRNSLSLKKCNSGDVIRGKVAQDVPLLNGLTIRRGSEIEGRIIEVLPAGTGSGPQVSIRFDKIYFQHGVINVTTNLRALAGFMEVMQTAVSEAGPDEGTPSNWSNTTQIGGDTVYGVGGPVMSAEDTWSVVGKSVPGGGVLAHVSAKDGSRCRGSVAGNDNFQAMWVFSSDACGIYGIEYLKIVHAGRTDPKGTIVLSADKQDLKLRSGDGLLLRVD